MATKQEADPPSGRLTFTLEPDPLTLTTALPVLSDFEHL